MCVIDTVAAGWISVPQRSGDTCTRSQDEVVRVAPVEIRLRTAFQPEKRKTLHQCFYVNPWDV